MTYKLQKGGKICAKGIAWAKQGAKLNQGKRDKLFVLSKTNRNHTLDGWIIFKGKSPKQDNTKSTAGYLKEIDSTKGLQQVGENLFIKPKYKKGGLITSYQFPKLKKGGRIDKDSLPCNKPRTNPTSSRHKKVVKACSDGKEKLIKFGHRDYKHNYSNKARKSYCARSGGIKDGKGKMSANYWSRKVLWNC